MELADTSAWTSRFRDAAVLAEFSGRLEDGEIATCGMVKLELLWSARDAADFARIRRNLDALELVPMNEDVWDRAVGVFGALAAEGPLHHRRVELADLLVAAAGELAGLPVCHYDADFELIASVTGQPVRPIAPIGSL